MLTTVLKVPEGPPQASSPGARKEIFQHCASARDFASQSSIWSPETASIVEILQFSTCEKIYSPMDLRNRDVGSPELLGKLSLIPEVCSLQVSSKSDRWILSTSHLKTRVAINMFDHNGPAFNPPPLLLYEPSCSNGSSRALRVMCEVHCASAQRNCF